KEGELVNFYDYSVPILGVLKRLGLNAEFKAKNSIVINDLKVSGMAEHVHKNRVLHHGTLLFNSDLSALSEALRADSGKYHDRAVKSIRSETTNISFFLTKKMGIAELGNEIINYTMDKNEGSKIYCLTNSDHETIQQLVKDKYSTWEWNYGYSPNYEFKRKIEVAAHEIEIYLKVKKGFITEITLSVDQFEDSLRDRLESMLIQQKHDENGIYEILKQSDLKSLLSPADIRDLTRSFF
ncbi:MAG: hypothetical protein AMS27_04295, partial [Bacteroides sp. SM23_62_1]